jgi:hypothetical protein
MIWTRLNGPRLDSRESSAPIYIGLHGVPQYTISVSHGRHHSSRLHNVHQIGRPANSGIYGNQKLMAFIEEPGDKSVG